MPLKPVKPINLKHGRRYIYTVINNDSWKIVEEGVYDSDLDELRCLVTRCGSTYLSVVRPTDTGMIIPCKRKYMCLIRNAYLKYFNELIANGAARNCVREEIESTMHSFTNRSAMRLPRLPFPMPDFGGASKPFTVGSKEEPAWAERLRAQAKENGV